MTISILNKLAAIQARALGIKPGDIYSPIPDKKQPFVTDLSLQKHMARKAGTHYDLRLNINGTGYSWAIPKAQLPNPGEKKLAIRTFDHDINYMTFSGELGKGYGEGKVDLQIYDKVDVLECTPGKIKFNVYPSGTEVQQYNLINTSGNNWIIQNNTKTRDTHPELPEYKHSYKEKSFKDIDVNDKGTLLSTKIDGCWCGRIKLCTNLGMLRISDIVNKKLPVKVLSYNQINKKLEYRNITNYFKYSAKKYNKLIQISWWDRNNYFVCTPNHRLINYEGVKIEANKLDSSILLAKPYSTLSNVQKEILYGCILGDSYISEHSVRFVHSKKQFNYILRKIKLFESLSGKLIEFEQKNTFRNRKNYSAARFPLYLKKNNILELKKLFIINNKKTITKKLLSKITPISLAFWFMDDGCGYYKKNKIYRLRLCTNSFSLKEHNVLISWFKSKFDIKATIEKSKKTFNLAFYGDNAKNFVKIIAPYIYPEMVYKLKAEALSQDIYNIIGNALLLEDTSTVKFDPVKIVFIAKSLFNKKTIERVKFVYDIEVDKNHNYIVQGGILSSNSHTIINLEPKKQVEAYSYRPSKLNPSGKINHTYKLPKLIGVKSPETLPKMILRGEVYGTDKVTGKAIPSEQLNGILNSATLKARTKLQNVDMKIGLFDVHSVAGENFEDKPYIDKLEILNKVIKEIPQFNIPRYAIDPEEKKQLINDVLSGKIKETKEGLTAFKLFSGGSKDIAKIKVRPDTDVVIEEVFPVRNNPELAGGFRYSLPGKDRTIVGNVGTGFSRAEREDMMKNFKNWKGRIARVTSQGAFPSGALRAPSFMSLHPDFPESINN